MNSRFASMLARQRGAVVGVVAFVIVSLVLTGMIAGTLGRGVGSTNTYQAVFIDASGLLPGDDVRISGVRVGKVQSVSLDGRTARVAFSLSKGQHLYPGTTATVEFLNLLGQRFIDLQDDASTLGSALPAGSVLGLDHTRVGLDLTAIFNAFRPLFEMIRPADVNELADNIVHVLQGEGPQLQNLTAQTATLTRTLVDRDQVIGAVIANLNQVMVTVNSHRTEIRSMVADLNNLTAIIAQNRVRIGDTIDAVEQAVTQFTAIVVGGGESLARDVADLKSWSASINGIAPQIGRGLKDTTVLTGGYVQTLGLGSFLNTYVCQSHLQVGTTTFNLSPSSAHSWRCP